MNRKTLITPPAQDRSNSQRGGETRQRGMSKATVDALFHFMSTGKTKPAAAAGAPAVGPNGDAPYLLSKDAGDTILDAVLSGEVRSRTPTGQFNKGSSGNPRGRPKQDPNPVTPPSELAPESLSAIALRHAATKVKAQTSDGEVEMTLMDATLAKMAREGARGNTGHARSFAQLVGRAETENIKLKREAFRHWSGVQEQASQLHGEAVRAGREPPLYVHPDDIQLYTDGTVELVGPTDPDAIAEMRQSYARVDYHLINVAYHRWIKRRWIRMGGRAIDGILCQELVFLCEQRELPPRLRLSDEYLNTHFREYARMSGRALHTELRRQAYRHGFPVPPRDLRKPVVVPREDLDIAKAHGADWKQFLPAWINAQKVALQSLVPSQKDEEP